MDMKPWVGCETIWYKKVDMVNYYAFIVNENNGFDEDEIEMFSVFILRSDLNVGVDTRATEQSLFIVK